jgi:pimeloyl-ACP methyl ester carboxylesterase
VSRLNESAYREAEEMLFTGYGVAVREHTLEPGANAPSFRVLETGEGEPAVFIHGSPNTAATWVTLTQHLQERRCLLIERPSSGLSPSPKWVDHREQSTAVVRAVFDHFELQRADIVASSLGGLYAYNFALTNPGSVRSMVFMGAPTGPLVLGLPAIMRFLAMPIPMFVLNRSMRPDADGARRMFAQIGHKTAVDSGSIPGFVFEWYASLLCNTDTAPGAVPETRAINTPFGYRSTAKLTDEQLASLTHPLLYLWGSEDSYGGAEKGNALAALTPSARIEHFEGFGHIPWYDDPQLIAERTEAFLAETA